MKVSCLPVSIYDLFASKKMSLLEWAIFAEEVGLDGFDVSCCMTEGCSEKQLKTIVSKFDELSISPVMFTTYTDFTNPYGQTTGRSQLKEYYETASMIGANLIRITVGPWYPNIRMKELLNNIQDEFAFIETLQKEYNIETVVENHGKPGIWEYTDFTSSKENFISIIPLLGELKINFDTANPIINAYDPMFIIEKSFEKIGSIHAADTGKYGEICPVIVGEGVVPIKKIINTVKKKGYEGWICIEEASGQGLQGIRKSAKRIMDMVKEL